MERRVFIRSCSVLCVSGMGLSGLLESCDSIHYASHSNEINRIKVNKMEFIGTKKNERKFVVIRSEKLQYPICVYSIGKEYVALYMQCTHQGCELHPNKTSLVCPCHGSEFSIEGKVQSPPADKDLKQFKVVTDNESIYIEI